MELSRRDALRAGAVGAAAAATGLAGFGGLIGTAVAGPGERHGHGTTLDRTLLLGTPGAGGYRPVVPGPGEGYLVRDDLVGGTVASRHRPGHRRRPILAFGQLTDIHAMDTQSPARVEFLDRYNDPDSPFAPFLPFESSYRAWEFLSAHISEAMVQGMNGVRRGPATGRPLAFTIATGDNTDNVQFNELRWYIDLLDGGRVRPDSGDLSRYEGVADGNAATYDQRYWHPDGTPAGLADDLPRSRYGYPRVPGLLDAARRPFRATGLRTPWLTAYGNHDGLIQGNLPPIPALSGLATGRAKIVGLPPGTDIIQLALWLQSLDPRGLQTLLGGPARAVTADPARRFVSRLETIREHFNTSGSPRGHGFGRWNLATGNAYYGVDHGLVRGLVLDTVNPAGGSEGSLDPEQFAWLERELTAGSSRYLTATGEVVRQRCRDRLFVLFSHHTIGSMDNLAGPVPRVSGAGVRDLLLRFPNAVLWVNGHTHRNKVTPYTRPAGSPVPGGFWEVNTAAHIDWPQQSRVVELIDNQDGTISVFGTIVDMGAPATYRRLDSPVALASLARQLAGNDWQARERPNPGEDGRRGTVADRNVELLLPAPFRIGGPHPRSEADATADAAAVPG
ncbi:MAG TPA: TIGR03767 family metallophosphoesterase [Pseudonocardiaceae bacterium]